MFLRIGQINAQRSSAAATELEILMSELELDLLCIQEPYQYKNVVRGYNSSKLRVIQPTGITPWVAAVAVHDKMDVLVHPGNNAHAIYFKIYTQTCNFYLINIYCQHSLPINTFLDFISDILIRIGGERFILTLDANAKSELWYSNETDDRGRLLEEFILTNDLIILNEPNNPPTFMTSNGQSNIDLTLASSNFGRSIKEWKVSLCCTTSDHNLITFKIVPDLQSFNLQKSLSIDKPYSLRRADWDGFETSVKTIFNNRIKEKLKNLKPDKAVQLFNKLLTQCCRENIPIKVAKDNTVPWWTEELKRLKIETSKSKKQLHRARKLNFNDLIPDYSLKYRILRNKYTALIRKNKKQTWKNFVTKEGNRDPWSLVYKIIRNKLNKETFLSALRLPSGELTTSWRDTADKLLYKCVPKDMTEDETEEQKEIKKKINLYHNSNLEPEISLDEISASLNKCKKHKAPGIDRFPSELIIELWNIDNNIIYNLYNNCMKNSYFPNEWKHAKLKIILKDPKRDQSVLSSYRPIALLSAVGKIFERILVNRIQECYKNLNLDNKKQFGFRPQRSTEDALNALRTGIKCSRKKYTVTIFIDIEAAFDCLWWPAIIAKIIKAECSSRIVKIIKSYFKNRRMSMQSKFDKIDKFMQRGCPQGSIIGPMAWGWCMDTFLDDFQNNIDEQDAEVIAYADDLAMIVKGNTRSELELIAERGLKILKAWCTNHKLNISLNKTLAMLTKGKLNRERLPRIKINDVKIKYSDKIKYLGVIVDEKLNFIEHAKFIRNKVIGLIMALKRVARDTWGIKTSIIKILYSAVFLPITTYGSSAWFQEVQKAHVMRHILAAQRSILLIITKACKTTSTIALQVLAGVLPLDLSIIRQALINKVKHNNTVNWRLYTYTHKENLRIADEPERIKEEIAKIDNLVYSEWQSRWCNDTRGRCTFDFIHDVRFRLNNGWFVPNRFSTYLITGYGPINSTLFKRKCVENKNCIICNLEEEEDINHIIFRCPKYQEFRYAEILNLDVEKSYLIDCQERFKKFSQFAEMVFERRRECLLQLDSSGSASSWLGRATSDFNSDG